MRIVSQSKKTDMPYDGMVISVGELKKLQIEIEGLFDTALKKMDLIKSIIKSEVE